MALDAPTRQLIGTAIQRYWSNLRESCVFLKAEIGPAIDAIDAWIESNQTSFNNALPVAFRTKATLVQKTVLFCYVAMKRANLNVQGE